MVKISIVAPVYNESKNLHEFYERTVKTLKSITEDYEIIFINDNSIDNSLEIIKSFSLKDNRVKYISFTRNFGHQIAICAGLNYCKGEAVVIIDTDLQDPPELIYEMWQKLKGGVKIVGAKRIRRKGDSFLKKATAKLFYRILKRLTKTNIPVDVGDFRMIHKDVVANFRKMREANKFVRGQIAWLGFQTDYVEFEREERKSGKTGYSFNKMLRLAIDAIVSFSDVPLKLATIAGFTVSFISLLIIIYALYSHFILQRTITGWTSLIISTMFIGGIQLLTIGIIGEYVSRIFHNVRQRPDYVIEETNIEIKE